MNMINKIFSDEIRSQFSSSLNSEIPNVDNRLTGLIVAGQCSFWSGDILWLLPEYSGFLEKRSELRQWMQLVGDFREIIVFPLPFGDPYVNNVIYPDYHIEKFNFIKSRIQKKSVVVIASLLSVSIGIETEDKLKDMIFVVRRGEKIKRDGFIEKLFEMGYSHSNYVDGQGEFHKRGGVVDLYPSGTENPVRIEFFGDEVESITVFNRYHRRSENQIDLIEIPVYGMFGKNMKFSDLLSLGGTKSLPEHLIDPKIIYNDRDSVQIGSKDSLDNFKKIYEFEGNSKIPSPEILLKADLSPFPYLNISCLTDEIYSKSELKKLNKNLRGYKTSDLEELKKVSQVSEVFLLTKSRGIVDNLRAGGIRLKSENFPIPHSFKNRITDSLFLTDRKFVYSDSVSLPDDFESENLLKTLKSNEFIVHEKHGIGLFKGMRVLKFGEVEQEFIKVEYLNSEILYVPVSEVNALKKYFSFKGDPGKLDKIGGKSWSRKKYNAKKSIISFAKELLDLYALRRSVKGFSHFGDSDMESYLRNSFPYVETQDQILAINDVMSDLEKSFPMERLICGDVSFGKTEVAVRAAMRVVGSGGQVALLCPTTILALQHFKTFSRRFSGLPVNIKMLSRMVSPKEQKLILKELEEGGIDILIGTHSILSNKAVYKNLRLFIIDEEQRFGVFQKEKLKQGKENVDVLVLSATPIPRTLSLSMAGLQDISTIRTPPMGRMKIRNYIGSFSKQIIISALLKEMERGGGVYIVYNSIEKIFEFKERLNNWLPDINVTVIHAQMKNDRIERNLMEFIKGAYSVLLSTTIIENGIDIEKANTLIVIEAEKFGLTQLYQLRGRIGRGELQAYAYFLTGSKIISEKAKLRLEGIRDHSDIGAGFKLAEYDLKLRGAGSLLGNKQHGHIEALGFDYYNSMLKQAVDELKGVGTKKWDGNINIHFKYFIGNDYILKSSDRIYYYSKIVKAKTFDEVDAIKTDLVNCYGMVGEEESKIFYVVKVKLIAALAETDSVDIFSNRFKLGFTKRDKMEIIFNELLSKGIKLNKDDSISFTVQFDGDEEILKEIYFFLKKFTDFTKKTYKSDIIFP